MLEDKKYLEVNLPKFLQDDIDAYIDGEKNNSTLIDALWDEVYGSINSALYGNQITDEQAKYLRAKYLWGDDSDTN